MHASWCASARMRPTPSRERCCSPAVPPLTWLTSASSILTTTDTSSRMNYLTWRSWTVAALDHNPHGREPTSTKICMLPDVFSLKTAPSPHGGLCDHYSSNKCMVLAAMRHGLQGAECVTHGQSSMECSPASINWSHSFMRTPPSSSTNESSCCPEQLTVIFFGN